MPKRLHNLPKDITLHVGKYSVKIYDKVEKRVYNVGRFDTVEQAIKERDEWLKNNKDKVPRYLPRGITKSATKGKYMAQVSFKTTEETEPVVRRLGTFNSIEEAVEYRTKFILGIL